jgi:hypothetical protein
MSSVFLPGPGKQFLHFIKTLLRLPEIFFEKGIFFPEVKFFSSNKNFHR